MAESEKELKSLLMTVKEEGEKVGLKLNTQKTKIMSSAYLRLLIFLSAVLIPACASSSLVFLMMYSAYKLNKLGDNIQPWCTPFSIWNQYAVSSLNCCFLTCIQISQEAGQVIWYSHLFKNFPQFVVIHTISFHSNPKEREWQRMFKLLHNRIHLTH